MAYKRPSPTPIAESGTNYTSMANTNGTIIYDGTGLSTISPGTSGWVLTSMGAAIAPSFEPLAGSGASWIGNGAGAGSQISSNGGSGGFYVNTINYFGAFPQGQNLQPAFVFPFACTLSNLYVIVTANSSSNNTTSYININGTNTAITVTIGAGVTGTFTDLTHTATVTAGSLMYLVSNATGAMGQIVNANWTIQVTP